MTEINQVVEVTVNVADTRVSREGFGTPLIFSLIEDTVFPERVRIYTTIQGVAVDFADTTKVYKAANAIFNQRRQPTFIKVGRREAGDASLTSALAAILAEDADFYNVLSTFRASDDIAEIALWVEANGKIFGACSEDADVLTAVDTDIASILEAFSYDRTYYMWHHQGGIDVTDAGYVIASGVATITEASHGLVVGDPVTFSNSSGISIDGNNTVASVPTTGTFTVSTTAEDEAGPDTVDYFANYIFPESAWAGYMLPSDPGSETWKFQAKGGLTGQAPAPTSALNPTEEARAKGKNANLYTTLGGVGHTHEGTMASGRFIDIQRGIDWLDARISENIANLLLNAPKIPYTDAGAAAFEASIAEVLDLGVRNGLLGPLLDDSGDFYRITIPKVASQTTADRQNRYFPGIVAQVQLAGAVHSLAITVNAQI
jgi:hypothetical protein